MNEPPVVEQVRKQLATIRKDNRMPTIILLGKAQTYAVVGWLNYVSNTTNIASTRIQLGLANNMLLFGIAVNVVDQTDYLLVL